MGRRRKYKRRKNKNNQKVLAYGFAILAIVFIIAGLSDSIRNYRNKQNEELTKKNEQEESVKEKQPQVDNPDIRVLIMTSGYKGIVHPEVKVSADSELIVSYSGKEERYKKGEKIKFKPDDQRFADGTLKISAVEGNIKINNIRRGYGIPSYAGFLELYRTSEGIVIVNQLPVETYLCGVVPSEMPASYEKEALKAQAVCARSYAYRQMKKYGYPEYQAHVNDSTDYQVYKNSKPADSTRQAVAETAGQTVRYNGEVVTTYYYSTSCGRTTTTEAWGTSSNDKNAYLQSVEVCGEQGDYEKDLPWYRWSAKISKEKLSELLQLNTQKNVGKLEGLEVTKTGPGNVVLEIKATGTNGTITVKTENKIRRALGGSGYKIKMNNGKKTDSRELLPSAFFAIEENEDNYVIKGGGFGHGIGMSQAGANEMAKNGKDYREILSLFYSNVTVE